MSEFGLNMRPILLCNRDVCGRAVTIRQPPRHIPNVDAALTCPDCGSRMVLAAYGIVDREASLSSLDEHSLRQAQGTWWR